MTRNSSLLLEWQEAQVWETAWWGTCVHTFVEENKQITYAHRMGLQIVPGGQWPLYDMEGRSVVDLGGGPVSMLLKCINVKGTVVDPAEWPNWVIDRYEAVGIQYVREQAEQFSGDGIWDEAWIYNCLQHVVHPKEVIATALSVAKRIRIFEWVNIPPYQGHLHELHAISLDDWLGIEGTVEDIKENGMNGRAYYGVTNG